MYTVLISLIPLLPYGFPYRYHLVQLHPIILVLHQRYTKFVLCIRICIETCSWTLSRIVDAIEQTSLTPPPPAPQYDLRLVYLKMLAFASDTVMAVLHIRVFYAWLVLMHYSDATASCWTTSRSRRAMRTTTTLTSSTHRRATPPPPVRMSTTRAARASHPMKYSTTMTIVKTTTATSLPPHRLLRRPHRRSAVTPSGASAARVARSTWTKRRVVASSRESAANR